MKSSHQIPTLNSLPERIRFQAQGSTAFMMKQNPHSDRLCLQRCGEKISAVTSVIESKNKLG